VLPSLPTADAGDVTFDSEIYMILSKTRSAKFEYPRTLRRFFIHSKMRESSGWVESHRPSYKYSVATSSSRFSILRRTLFISRFAVEFFVLLAKRLDFNFNGRCV